MLENIKKRLYVVGAEIGIHRNFHTYKFMDAGTLSVFKGRNGFSSKEHLHLLDAIEQFGFGNWQDISKHIETKSPEDAKEEYIAKFLHGTIGRHTWSTQFENRPVLKDHTIPHEASKLVRASTTSDKIPPLDILSEEAQQLGYLMNREDFEIEYDASAEQIISHLDMKQEDEEMDLKIKLAHIQAYSRRLKERMRRKRLVRDYQLAAQFFRGSRRYKTKDQREFRDRFKTFCQFFTSPQYERLIYSLEEERQLREKLANLNGYRAAGLQKIDDCIYYEQQQMLLRSNSTGNNSGGYSQPKSKGIVGNTERLQFLNQLVQARSKTVTGVTAPQTVNDHYTSHTKNQPNDADVPKEISQLQELAVQTRRQLLSSNEMQLCSVTSVPATNYITLKTIMLSDMAKPPANTTEKLIKNYFTKSGWLQQ